MTCTAGPVSLFLLLTLNGYHDLLCQDEFAAAAMAGISNKGKTQQDPYVTAGDRAYLIGTQDGAFPDLGGHVPGEMGGLWLHPIKLIDGFWARLTDLDNNQEVELSESAEFINYPYGNRFRYRPVLNGIEVERFQFSPDARPGIIVQYRFANPTTHTRRLRLELAVKTELTPVWLSADSLGSRTRRTPS